MLKPSEPRKLVSQHIPRLGPSKPRGEFNRILRNTGTRRECINGIHETNALNLLKRLPENGEAFHFVISRYFEPCDLIPAVRILSDPAVIKTLTVTTLGLNVDNVATIAAGMHQGKVLDCTILVSQFFRRMNPETYNFLVQEIRGRGGHVGFGNNHTKIMLFEMSDGNHYSIEGSGNIRACSAIEQFMMVNDKTVYDFHREWILEFMKEVTIDGTR